MVKILMFILTFGHKKKDFRNMNTVEDFVIKAIQREQPPREVMEKLGIDVSQFPENMLDSDLWVIILNILKESRRRHHYQRTYIKSIHEVMQLIEKSTKIVAVIGAGASVGPDFRSPGGLYDQIAKSGALDDPYKVFDMEYFVRDPSVFWRFAHLIYPSTDPEHSQAHYFLAELEKRGKLLRVYSQNVDTLEVGIPNEKLRCVHGSWRENKCLECGEIHDIEDLRECVNNQTIPKCKKCGGQIKPGIVFFGQRTNIEDEDIEYDSKNADLLIVIGTSLRVAPVSYIPEMMYKVPSILINREPVSCQFNAELLGEGDAVVTAIENELGWIESKSKPESETETKSDSGVNTKKAENFVFIQPNKFVMPSDDGVGTQFAETGRSLFLVCPAYAGTDSFE
ncbi:transcriptional regulator, Sir2 family protein [Tritrichomonas foetus]|uniref:Transcriptional regulator, Sir2 family protein n=1 Tax=Tritrichomonas foetus TaxID=1144522 RepID=A0A1J4JC01_9EUKA|nr:transcriptional regulator, Sir2 family protein [Tritrichomonas foetus]|eukprot:OHS96730.1 transcriptional regulator, Sir2 family protein [Tritrichomonas foetus]